MPSTKIQCRVPDELCKRMDAVAARAGWDRSDVIRKALLEFVPAAEKSQALMSGPIGTVIAELVSVAPGISDTEAAELRTAVRKLQSRGEASGQMRLEQA